MEESSAGEAPPHPRPLSLGGERGEERPACTFHSEEVFEWLRRFISNA
jgi:hypothetical protein